MILERRPLELDPQYCRDHEHKHHQTISNHPLFSIALAITALGSVTANWERKDGYHLSEFWTFPDNYMGLIFPFFCKSAVNYWKNRNLESLKWTPKISCRQFGSIRDIRQWRWQKDVTPNYKLASWKTRSCSWSVETWNKTAYACTVQKLSWHEQIWNIETKVTFSCRALTS